jgi:hypothetical protein
MIQRIMNKWIRNGRLWRRKLWRTSMHLKGGVWGEQMDVNDQDGMKE